MKEKTKEQKELTRNRHNPQTPHPSPAAHAFPFRSHSFALYSFFPNPCPDMGRQRTARNLCMLGTDVPEGGGVRGGVARWTLTGMGIETEI
jgi:hypothetical protein